MSANFIPAAKLIDLEALNKAEAPSEQHSPAKLFISKFYISRGAVWKCQAKANVS